MLVLDDVPYEMDFVNLTKPENLHKIGKHAMCGNIYDIWFDKTFTVNIGTNAKVRKEGGSGRVKFFNSQKS